MNNIHTDQSTTALDLDSFKTEVNTKFAHIIDLLQALDNMIFLFRNSVSRGRDDLICRIDKQEATLTGHIETIWKQIVEVVSIFQSSSNVTKEENKNE